MYTSAKVKMTAESVIYKSFVVHGFPCDCATITWMYTVPKRAT
jgi:hypothetical protein